MKINIWGKLMEDKGYLVKICYIGFSGAVSGLIRV